MANSDLGRFQGLRDGPGDAAPALRFDFQLLLPGLRQPIIFRAAVVLRFSPKGGNPPFFFHSVEGGEERTGLDIKGAPGDLLDSARDPEPVLFARDQRLEDKQIQGALKQGCGLRVQSGSPVESL
jgi:hypothetical protein